MLSNWVWFSKHTDWHVIKDFYVTIYLSPTVCNLLGVFLHHMLLYREAPLSSPVLFQGNHSNTHKKFNIILYAYIHIKLIIYQLRSTSMDIVVHVDLYCILYRYIDIDIYICIYICIMIVAQRVNIMNIDCRRGKTFGIIAFSPTIAPPHLTTGATIW